MSTGLVERHYGEPNLLEKVLATLREAGLDPDQLTAEELFSHDHFHSRGTLATQELFDLAGFQVGQSVLDIGSGIGGPARFLASKGLRVTGIDLTPEFVEVARELTRRTMPNAGLEFALGSALTSPFPAGSFDGAWMQHVTMNIEDKPGLFREVGRVVKLGGRLAFHEVVAGDAGEPNLPLPWATDAAASHLVRRADFRAAIERNGWTVPELRDETDNTLSFLDAMLAKAGSKPLTGTRILAGPGHAERFANFRQALAEDRCRIVMAVAERTR
ncbi:MAG: class I SAM-dependent methyltransferase [Fimbriimonadaceae bacterium]|nr:class I SAM-dependent methyltransferase [Fimbriimonadaceae bacterium]